VTGPQRHPGEEPGGDPRPWEEPGGVRRDCEPHRGNWLRLLGNVSVACGLLSFVLVVPALVAMPLGTVVTVLARRDLAQMQSGAMDPAGRPQVEGAAHAAVVGAVLGALAWLFFPCTFRVLEFLRSVLAWP
jgi:hypothetical protein